MCCEIHCVLLPVCTAATDVSAMCKYWESFCLCICVNFSIFMMSLFVVVYACCSLYKMYIYYGCWHIVVIWFHMLWGRMIGARGGRGLHRLPCNYYIEFLNFKSTRLSSLWTLRHRLFVWLSRSSWSPHSRFGCPVAFSTNCRRRHQTPSAVLLVSDYSF
jgi:hypothetical protein